VRGVQQVCTGSPCILLVNLTPIPGYPPADDAVRDYLTPALSQAVAYNRMCAFLEALFQHTRETIQNFDDSELENLPATFRRKMTEGQMYTSVNSFRKNFYAAVVQKAKIREGQVRNRFALRYVILNHVQQQLQSRDQPPIYNTPSRKDKQDKHDFAPAQACEELITVIRSLRAQRQGTPTPGEDDAGPEVILAFDEAHTMATPIKTVPNPMEIPVFSSNFNELRKVLRSLNKFPIFSLFCSTTGKISLFTPAPGYDKSKRVLLRQLILIEPFTELPFDALAEKVQLGNKLKLEKVTGDAHIVRLGRPMCVSLPIHFSVPVWLTLSSTGLQPCTKMATKLSKRILSNLRQPSYSTPTSPTLDS
jgi:hypothetical protein